VCAVIVGLFVTAYYAWTPDLTRLLAAVFAAAVLALILGLLTFLREVYLATRTLRIGHRH
jgi:ABC-type branched-subunit amino acid transport system permease subunit